jgi:hypothetical protein
MGMKASLFRVQQLSFAAVPPGAGKDPSDDRNEIGATGLSAARLGRYKTTHGMRIRCNMADALIARSGRGNNERTAVEFKRKARANITVK